MFRKIIDGLRNALARHWQLKLATIALLAVVGWINPPTLETTINKLSLATLGALVGYQIDALVFDYARPSQVPEAVVPSAMLRRALIMAAIVIGVTLGV